ncbi:MAG: thiamine phosphate synthase [Clostridiales bacterium]|nr:thiamine phosphate synthase [Clostridiales bacterium]
MNLSPQHLRLYAVTDRAWTSRQTLLEQLEDALEGGVTLVQLREKDLPQEDFLAEALAAKELCHRYGVPLLINDNVDLALQCGADGVHVGAEDMPVAEIRRLAGPGFIVGATAKTVAQAQAAQAAGADYLGVGALFPSPTKPNAVGITKRELADICASVSIPVVAIGGITQENLPQLAGSGAVGAAVVSAIFGAQDVRAAAQALDRLTRTIFP